jgi:hypothetical protein
MTRRVAKAPERVGREPKRGDICRCGKRRMRHCSDPLHNCWNDPGSTCDTFVLKLRAAAGKREAKR